MSDDHYSLSSRVFHAIREDILNGKYQANEELKEKYLKLLSKVENAQKILN